MNAGQQKTKKRVKREKIDSAFSSPLQLQVSPFEIVVILEYLAFPYEKFIPLKEKKTKAR